MNTAQVINTLGGKLSTETGLSLLPFITNPQQEMKKIQAENGPNSIGQKILDNIDSSGGGAA